MRKSTYLYYLLPFLLLLYRLYWRQFLWLFLFSGTKIAAVVCSSVVHVNAFSMLKLKLQYFGHLMRRVDSLEKTLMLGGIGGRRRRGRQRMRWLDGINGRESEWTRGDGDGQGGLVCCDSWGRRVGHDWATELNWTELVAVFASFSVHLWLKMVF